MSSPPDLISPPETRRETGDDVHDLIEDARDYLSPHGAALRQAGIEVELKAVAEHDVAGAIVEEAANGYDLVAMATHGRPGLARLALGSVAMEVLKRTAVPLMLVRPDANV